MTLISVGWYGTKRQMGGHFVLQGKPMELMVQGEQKKEIEVG
jgi:hypothetical protein